ncbi:Gp59 protein [Candidatus Vecturithrix granuli]|uniref:Gp59 protein n=1 Tax=Vecturithrix granuli TaxID=1499967 RepID=A0A081CB14_VECG1|nr:Gp59 protein [Candidatus Vecturithrix granuli]
MTDVSNTEIKPSKTVLMEAENIINGERRQQYGAVLESFQQVADFWSTYIERHVRKFIANYNERRDYTAAIVPPVPLVSLSGEDVANMMILMKTSRAQNGFHRDSYVDIAGYSGCVEKMQDERSH